MDSNANFFSREEVAHLSERSDWMGFCLVIHCYAIMAMALVIYSIFPNTATFFLALIIIGSRQLGLAILMHDAAHGTLFKSSKLNNVVGEWFCGSPILAELGSYRRYHLKHHKHTQTPEDPDLVLSAPFPISRASLLRKLFRDVTGQTGLKLILLPRIKNAIKRYVGIQQVDSDKYAQSFKSPGIVHPFYCNSVIFIAMMAFGDWWWWFAFWLLPLLTWFQVVVRLRNIAEHAGTEFSSSKLQNVRTTSVNLLTQLFIAPYWVNYHLEHHLMMYVPCWRLSKMHKMLVTKGYAPKIKLAKGYLAVLREVIV